MIKELSYDKLPSREFLVEGYHMEVDGDTYLLIIFYANNKEYFMFITKDDYITFEKKSGKWQTASIEKIVGYQGLYKLNFSSYTKEFIKSFLLEWSIDFSKVNSVSDMIFKHQANIRSIRLEKKHNKIRYEIDCVMMKIKPLPKKICTWINRIAHYKSRYIFYKGKIGYCSVCNKESIPLKRPRHNENGVCRECRTKIVYKALGYSKNVIDHCQFTYLQKTDNGFFIRIFSSSKDYSKDIKAPEIKYHELRRYYIQGDKISYYHYGRFLNKEYRWCNGVRSGGLYVGYFTDKGAVYTRNIKAVLNGTLYMSSALSEYIKYVGNYKIDVEDYLYKYYKHPSIEHFFKSGLFRIFDRILLTGQCIKLYEGKRFYQRLGITKEHYNMLRAVDGNKETIILLRFIRENSLKIDLDQLQWIVTYNLQEQLMKVLKYTTVTKALNYLKKDDKEDFKGRLNTWIDYLKMCIKLKYDLKNSMTLFPKELNRRHDEATLLWTETNIELCDAYLKARYKATNERYGFIFRDLSIIAPKNRVEILREGEALNHCVRTKVEDAALGETTILFVRKSDQVDKSYYTLEVSNQNTINQCRGYENAKQTEDIKELLSAYDIKRLSQLK